jgi:hypothetical protein
MQIGNAVMQELEEPGDLMRLTTKELTLISAFSELHSVEIRPHEKNFWAVDIHIDGNDRPCSVATSRGLVKVWRDLESVMTFVVKNFAHSQKVSLVFEDWHFEKIQNCPIPQT